MERLGFQREGYLRERWQVNGEIQDTLFYGLLRPDWKTTLKGKAGLGQAPDLLVTGQAGMS